MSEQELTSERKKLIGACLKLLKITSIWSRKLGKKENIEDVYNTLLDVFNSLKGKKDNEDNTARK